jgi:manganese/zinc/iron transport system substrate-binding protein
MKWFLSLLILILVGCSKSDNKRITWEAWTQNNGKIKVLSTTAMIDDLSKEIGGDKVDRLTLILGEIDPHRYELVKGDEEKISSATLVLYNGLGLEHGASLQYQLQHHPHTMALGAEIQKADPESILWVDGQMDPHIWMDISLWAKAIDPIVEAFSKLDPNHRDFFLENGKKLFLKMKAAHEKILQSLQETPPQKRFLVTSHDAFNYFAKAYLAEKNEKKNGEWKKRFAAPEGLAPDGQLSGADIQEIVDHLILYRIPVVFPETNVSRDSLKKIVNACKQQGLSVRISALALYGDAMGPPGSNAQSYLEMLQYDSDVLLEEWKK